MAGAQLITWCGEQIDDKGIGNGVSLIIFASIVSNWSSLYTSVKGLYGFPGTACISLNDTVIHGIPSHDIVIRPGDIVSRCV